MKKIIAVVLIILLMNMSNSMAYFEDNMIFESTGVSGNDYYNYMISNENTTILFGGSGFVSHDGLNFKSIGIYLSDVILVEDEFWAYNENSLYTSYDGEHWQVIDTNINITCMYYDGDKVIIGEYINNKPYLRIYKNSIKIETYALNISETIRHIIKKGDVYYSLVGGGAFYINSSVDLQNWSRVGTKSYTEGYILLTENRFFNIDRIIKYSDDGINWVTSSLPATDICLYENNQIAAFDGHSNIYITDGESYSILSNNISKTSGSHFKVLKIMNSDYIFMNNSVYKVEEQTAKIQFSIYNDIIIKKYSDICYGNGVFATIGVTYDSKPAVSVSSDGYKWENYYIDGFKYGCLSIRFDGNQFVATSYGDSVNMPTYATSTDAKNWTVYSAPGGDYGMYLYLSITFKGTDAYAIVSHGYKRQPSKIFKKTINSDWVEVYSTSNFLSDIQCFDDELMVVGSNGMILSSTNGTQWVSQVSNTVRELKQIAKRGNEILVFGSDIVNHESLAVKRSSNGIWEEQIMPTENFQALVRITPYVFFRTVLMNLQQISDDGINWRFLSQENYIRKYATDGKIIVEMAENYYVIGRKRPLDFLVKSSFVAPNGIELNNTGNAGTVIVNMLITNPQKINLTCIIGLYRDNKLISIYSNNNNTYDDFNNAVTSARFKNILPTDKIKTFTWSSISSMSPIVN